MICSLFQGMKVRLCSMSGIYSEHVHKISTNSWLIIIGGFLEGQCKGHADFTSALLVQPWIAFSCKAVLAIHRLPFIPNHQGIMQHTVPLKMQVNVSIKTLLYKKIMYKIMKHCLLNILNKHRVGNCC